MRYVWIVLLALGLAITLGPGAVSDSLGEDPPSPRSQFDIDGERTTKEIPTTTKESESEPTRFTFVSPAHANENRAYNVQALVQFLRGGTATGEALPQDFECEGLVWTKPGPFDCSNSHTFEGTIIMLEDQQSTGWTFPHNSYEWMTKFTGRPCGGSGGAPDYWEFYAQQYTLAVTLSVDSNNDGNINNDDTPEKRNPPGVIFSVNNGDVNEDGIPDMEQVALTRAFTEMRVRLHAEIEPEDLMLRFLYQGATAGSMPEGSDPALRIWKTNGTDPNRSNSDYLYPEIWYHAGEQLGFVGSNSEQTFFLEGVRPGSQTITAELAYNNQTSAVNFQPSQQDEVAVDEVEVTAVLVEIINEAGDPVDALSIGLWENAFENPTTSPVEKTDFMDLDPRRFFVRVRGFSEDPGNLITLRLHTESPDPDYAQEEVVVPLEWTNGLLISESLLLVSDEVDQAVLPGRTILCMLGSTINTSMRITPGAADITGPQAGVPIESIATMSIRPVGVRHLGDLGYLTPEPLVKILEYIDICRTIFAQTGIEVNSQTVSYENQPRFTCQQSGCHPMNGCDNCRTWTAWDQPSPPGSDGLFLNAFTVQHETLDGRVSTTARQIVDELGAATPLTVFFVKSIARYTNTFSDGSKNYDTSYKGAAIFPDGFPNETDQNYFGFAFVRGSLMADNEPNTMAHELGHILTDSGHPDEGEMVNIMFIDPAWLGLVTDGKRFTETQQQDMRGSGYVD